MKACEGYINGEIKNGQKFVRMGNDKKIAGKVERDYGREREGNRVSE